VLSGAGENTCGNTRCKHHTQDTIQLSTLELPFAYEEQGEHKSALVKVVLCPRCLKKLMWKRNKEKEVHIATPLEGPIEPRNHEDMADIASDMNRRSRDNRRESEAVETEPPIRRRSSRSRSPSDRKDAHRSRRRRRSTPP
jgi:protein FRA10AC1